MSTFPNVPMSQCRNVPMTLPLPRIAITVGDPSGIGPEIAIKAAADARVREVCEPILYGPTAAADLASYPAGQVSAAAGQAAYAEIARATADALSGRVA